MTILYVNYNNYMKKEKFLITEKPIFDYMIEQAKENNINVLTVNDNSPLMKEAIDKIPQSYKNHTDQKWSINFLTNAIRIFIIKKLLDSNYDDEILYLDIDMCTPDLKSIIDHIKNDKKIQQNKFALSFCCELFESITYYTDYVRTFLQLEEKQITSTPLCCLYFKKGCERLDDLYNFYKNYPVSPFFDNMFPYDDLVINYTISKFFPSRDEIPALGWYVSYYSFTKDCHLIFLHDAQSIHMAQNLEGPCFYITCNKSVLKEINKPILFLPTFNKEILIFLLKSRKTGSIKEYSEIKDNKLIEHLDSDTCYNLYNNGNTYEY